MSKDTIMALVDGSTYAESVCHHAAWIAGRTGAGVRVYHVMGRREAPDTRDLSGALRLGARTKLMEELSALDAQRSRLAQEQGRAILEDAKAIIEGDGAIRVETRLRHGDLVETIAAKEDTGDMIVIGKRGEAADFATGHLGSNLERIVRAAHKPVFVASRAFAPIERVLVAFDGGTSALKAVDYIAREPLFAGLSVTLVFAGRETAEMRRAMETAQGVLSAGGFAAEVEMRAGEPERVLAEMTEDRRHQLLVMGAYGHSRVRTLIIGSTTSEMMRSCKVPVLLMR